MCWTYIQYNQLSKSGDLVMKILRVVCVIRGKRYVNNGRDARISLKEYPLGSKRLKQYVMRLVDRHFFRWKVAMFISSICSYSGCIWDSLFEIIIDSYATWSLLVLNQKQINRNLKVFCTRRVKTHQNILKVHKSCQIYDIQIVWMYQRLLLVPKLLLILSSRNFGGATRYF